MMASTWIWADRNKKNIVRAWPFSGVTLDRKSKELGSLREHFESARTEHRKTATQPTTMQPNPTQLNSAAVDWQVGWSCVWLGWVRLCLVELSLVGLSWVALCWAGLS